MTFVWKWLGNNTYDVWVGNGWDNWSRVNVSRHGLHYVGGNRLMAGTSKSVHQSIMKSSSWTSSLSISIASITIENSILVSGA